MGFASRWVSAVSNAGQMFLPSVIFAKASRKIYISISATELPRAKVGMS
jgi:hypothetical protein